MKSVQEIRNTAIDTVLTHLRSLAKSGQPIVIGPWLGEIGFELLYWIPFLRWAQRSVGLTPDQLTVVSRGGCQSWYSDITPHYIELYDHYTQAELRHGNDLRILEQGYAGRLLGCRRGFRSAKQHAVFTFDREILARVAPDAQVLHPSLMYTLFRWYWRSRVPDLYERCAIVRRMTAPAAAVSLPESYIAVKFYSSQACEATGAYRRHVNRIMTLLVDTAPVVVLDSGADYDEHCSFPIEHAQVLRPVLEPRTNLATQTAIIAGATSFVGTYGGFAYLAPLLGVPTTAFYTARNFRDDHYALASRIFAKKRVRFVVRHLEDGATALRRDWKAWTHAA